MNFKPNDIIVPDALDYPNGALRVQSWDGKTLTAYPEGGGFACNFDTDAIKKYNFYVVDIELITPKWRKAKFSIDGGREFEGYHWGRLWNGWACPMFTIEVMREIADDIGDEWLRIEGDTVIHCGPDGEVYPDEGTVRQRNGIPTMRLYSFDGWCWDEVTWNKDGGESCASS